MGNFEDKIRARFETREFPLNSRSWEEMESRLDQIQMSDLVFTQKLSNAFNFSAVPFNPSHWNQMVSKLNQGSADTFEKGIQAKLSNAAVGGAKGWEEFQAKLEAQENAFNQQVKNTLNEGTAPYQQRHWVAFEQHLATGGNKRPFYWAASLLLLVAIGYGVYQMNGENSTRTQNQAHAKGADQPSIEESKKNRESSFDQGEKGAAIAIAQGLAGEGQLRATTNTGLSMSVGTSDERAEYRSNSGSINRTEAEQKWEKQVEKLEESHLNIVGSRQLENVELENEISSIKAGLESNLLLQSAEVKVAPYEPSVRPAPFGLSSKLLLQNNPAYLGVYGTSRAGLYVDEEYKTLNQYGQVVDSRFNQPLKYYGSYEQRIGRSGWYAGAVLGNTMTDFWNFMSAELNVSKRINWNGFSLSGGVNVAYNVSNYRKNELSFGTSEDLVSEQVSNTRHLTASAGIAINHKYFVLSYRAQDFYALKLSYDAQVLLEHDLFAAIHIPNASPLELTLYSSAAYNSRGLRYTPGAVVTLADKLYVSFEYENWERPTLGLGAQFRNGLRLFCAYGQSLKKESESDLRSLYSYQHNFKLGVEYFFNQK